jgi:hypothetical protein
LTSSEFKYIIAPVEGNEGLQTVCKIPFGKDKENEKDDASKIHHPQECV